MGEGHGPVLAVEGHPSERAAQSVKARHGDTRRPAVTNVSGAIGPRDFEQVESDVLAVVLGSAGLSHSGKTQGAVNQEGGRETPGVPERRRLDQNVGAARLACRAGAADGGVEPAIV